MSYQNQEMDTLIDAARKAAAENDNAAYEKSVKGFVEMAFAEVPRIPLFQPYLDVAMQKNISGYRYWFHRQLDYRTLAKRVSARAPAGEGASGRCCGIDGAQAACWSRCRASSAW